MTARPDFIIIGAMKCGTSTLHEQLAQQPGIFMTTPKEPNFFSDDEQYALGSEWYELLFEEASPGDLKGESSTHYTKWPTYPDTVRRMTEYLPDIRLVYIIRHPIDRLVSHYVHAWTENWIDEPIEQAIETYPPLIAYSEYARQLEPYIEAYGAERIRVIFLERLVREPQYVLEDVARFIGCAGKVSWRDQIARQNVSSERLRKSAWRDAIVHAPVMSQIRRNLIPPAVREWVKGFWRMADRPELPSSCVSALEERFDADLARLGAWFGVPLRCANFRDVATLCDLRWTSKTTAVQT